MLISMSFKTRSLFMTVSTTVSLALLAATSAVHAEPTAAKAELISKILQIQRPAIEGIATALAQQPAAQMMQGAGVALQTRVPADKREALAKEIQADIKKYVDEAVPLLREKAIKLAPTSIGSVLDEKFTEDELRDLIKIMESPVNKKFGQLSPDFQKALGEKLVADARPVIDPKVKALDQAIAKRLGITPAAAAPAKAASK